MDEESMDFVILKAGKLDVVFTKRERVGFWVISVRDKRTWCLLWEVRPLIDLMPL
jgi:hypothetical protein